MKQSKIELVKFLKDGFEAAHAYLNTIPRDIRSGIFDNTYYDNQNEMINALVSAHFKTMAIDVNWFLYEFEAGKTAGPHVSIDGVDYYFNTNEDYYKYLEAQ